MTRYRPATAAPELSDVLVCCWSATMEGEQLLVPDGCIDVLWIAGIGVRVCGPETTAWKVAYPTPTEAVGVRFRPGAAPATLATSAAELRNTRVDLGDVLGSRIARLLVDELDHAPTAAARLGALQRAVSAWRSDRRGVDPLMAQVGRTLAASPCAIDRLAEAASLTDRQLRRRCADAFGYGPATLRSILRLQRFMHLARRRPSLGLADLAIEAGYSDQPHLAKECRRIAGTTPAVLLDSQAPDWHGGAPLFAGRPAGVRGEVGGIRGADDGIDVRSVQDADLVGGRASAA